jgi:CheY-like chemotaxis protein
MALSDVADWRVLVIDDEADSVEVVSLVLTAAGATVWETANGREGLAVFKQEHPSLVLTDLSMPDMDGWELLKEIRNNEDGRHVPIIALTAHAMTGDRERVLEAGFDGYLSKPLKMFTLVESLLKCLGHLDGASGKDH